MPRIILNTHIFYIHTFFQIAGHLNPSGHFNPSNISNYFSPKKKNMQQLLNQLEKDHIFTFIFINTVNESHLIEIPLNFILTYIHNIDKKQLIWKIRTYICKVRTTLSLLKNTALNIFFLFIYNLYVGKRHLVPMVFQDIIVKKRSRINLKNLIEYQKFLISIFQRINYLYSLNQVEFVEKLPDFTSFFIATIGTNVPRDNGKFNREISILFENKNISFLQKSDKSKSLVLIWKKSFLPKPGSLVEKFKSLQPLSMIPSILSTVYFLCSRRFLISNNEEHLEYTYNNVIEIYDKIFKKPYMEFLYRFHLSENTLFGAAIQNMCVKKLFCMYCNYELNVENRKILYRYQRKANDTKSNNISHKYEEVFKRQIMPLISNLIVRRKKTKSGLTKKKTSSKEKKKKKKCSK